MRKISVIAVGNLKEKYWRDAVSEYTKRMRPYASLEWVEIPEEKTFKEPNESQKQEILKKEGERILQKIKPNQFVVSLCIEGKQMSSEEFSQFFQDRSLEGDSDFAFIIGGSYGLSDEVKRASGKKLSFSKMTFPHQMMRAVLAEQMYRAMKIEAHEPYHK